MKFIANLRRKLFNWRINREIFQKIFPHLRQEANHGYPFKSDDELVRLQIHSGLNAQMKFDMIERMAAKMPKAYSEAFRYVAYRDLNERMEMYLEVAKERIQPETCDPRFVATRAEA